jgi:hypothetical protein
MNIEEQRIHINDTNNTAQLFLLNLLEDIDTNVNELHINNSLYGIIDFSVLKERGFNNIVTILFVPGQITEINNLPKTLITLKCPDQLLVDIDKLPEKLEVFDCEYNYIKRLDLSNTKRIKKINISNNQIEELENLPETLEELYCNNNKIQSLDLSISRHLRVLHCSNNKTIILKNIPTSLIDFQSENNPYIELEYEKITKERQLKHTKEMKLKINYVESIHSYFKLKNKYETNHKTAIRQIVNKIHNKKDRKKMVGQIVKKCIQCKRPGGTTFSLLNKTYVARCNSNVSPLCKLNIKIYNGNYNNIEELVYMFKEQIDFLKDEMIIQKMDTLFNYISESESVKLFNESLKTYNEDSAIYKNFINKYNDLYNNENRQELIKRKMDNIYVLSGKINNITEQYSNEEHKNVNNRELLKTAMEVYINELIPEIRNLQLLKYDSMEMVSEGVPSGNLKSIQDKSETAILDGDTGVSRKYLLNMRLIQRHVGIDKTDYTIGEPSNVIEYST